MSGILPRSSGNSPGSSPPTAAHPVELRRRNSDINVMLQLPYYHPFISNIDQVLLIMAPYGNRSGHFLLRNSFSRPGTYTVSLTHASGIKHISIATSYNKFYLKDKPFQSMRDLVDYYSHVPVPNEEYVENVMLQYPIIRDFLNAGIACDNSIEEEKEPPPGGESLRTIDYLSTTGPGGLIEPSTSPTVYNETYEMYYSIVKERKILAKNRFAGSRHLQMVEDKRDEKCECGLLINASRLPHNWSVHVSWEPITYGRIFFLGPDTNTTWELPMKIAVELAPDQQDKLRDLLRASDNYLTATATIAQRPLPAIPGRSTSHSEGDDRL